MTVMFLILMGLYLTFAAFALDLGNLYLWKLRLDKAARAGALAGLGQRGLVGYWQATQGGNLTQQAAEGAAWDSLRPHIDNVEANIRTTGTQYIPAGDQLIMQVAYDVPTILVGRLTNVLGYGFNPASGQSPNSKITMTATHTSTLKPLNIVLAIDVSGSMLCPVVGSCACRRTGTCTGQTKLGQMVQGVQTFVRQFNPFRDRIAVIPFNLGAQRLYSLLDASGNPVSLQNSPSLNSSVTGATAWNFFATDTVANITNTFTNNLAGGNTNHCDALAEAINELESLSQRQFWPQDANDRTQLQPFVVFFTDGAPNAMRGVFTQNLNCLTYSNGAYSGAPASCGTNPDMYHYGLEWVAQTPTVPVSTIQYRGPGPFVVRATNANGIPNIFRHNITANTVAPNNARVCGQHIADPTQFESTIVNQQGGQRRINGTGCLPTVPGPTGTFSFAIPYTNFDNTSNSYAGSYRATVSNVPISTASTTWWDRNWPVTFLPVPAGTTYGVQKYDELPYYCAIEAADYLRTRFGATIFTVGLGPQAVHDRNGGENSPTCNDPLQDADDHVGRKDFFLSRLAFARQMFSDPAVPVDVPPHYMFRLSPQFNRTVTSCQQQDLITPHRLGQNDLLNRTPPQVSIGYTAAAGLADGATTYRDLRPVKPIWMDGQATTASSTTRRRIDTQGEYFPTNNAADIPAIFATIAKSILLRSTS